MNEKERIIRSIELQIKSIDETITSLNRKRNDLLIKFDKLN